MLRDKLFEYFKSLEEYKELEKEAVKLNNRLSAYSHNINDLSKDIARDIGSLQKQPERVVGLTPQYFSRAGIEFTYKDTKYIVETDIKGEQLFCNVSFSPEEADSMLMINALKR